MKWLRKLFKRTYATVQFKVPGHWCDAVVFNVPFRVIPALGEIIKYQGRTWKVTEVDAYDDGTPCLTTVLC